MVAVAALAQSASAAIAGKRALPCPNLTLSIHSPDLLTWMFL
jgi:hypothetical protein